jgi:hypothetical protein
MLYIVTHGSELGVRRALSQQVTIQWSLVAVDVTPISEVIYLITPFDSRRDLQISIMNEFTIPSTILNFFCNLLTKFVVLLKETGTLILLIIQKSG